MAISTYAELQTAVANWLDRDDLTDRIPEFITLAEAKMNRVLRISLMENISTAISTVGGQRDYSLPAGFTGMKEFHLNTDPLTPLSYLTPEMMSRLWAGSTSGKPRAFTLFSDGGTRKIKLGPAPDAVYTTSMLYLKKIDNLSVANPTETMLTENPDIYLYGALLEAEPFLMNDGRVQLWAGLLQKVAQDLQDRDNFDRHSGSELRVINTGGYP
tara:strand:+ start:283 stop:924 length:642 start_codon:yes stop_codon:yes gene_type:complete